MFFGVHRKYAYISTILAITNRFSTMMSWCIAIEPNLDSCLNAVMFLPPPQEEEFPDPSQLNKDWLGSLEASVAEATRVTVFDVGSDEFILM